MQDEIFQMKDFIKEDRANLDILQSFITIHDLLTLNLNADIYNIDQIGRASCRARVKIGVVSVALKKNRCALSSNSHI